MSPEEAKEQSDEAVALTEMQEHIDGRDKGNPWGKDHPGVEGMPYEATSPEAGAGLNGMPKSDGLKSDGLKSDGLKSGSRDPFDDLNQEIHSNLIFKCVNEGCDNEAAPDRDGTCVDCSH